MSTPGGNHGYIIVSGASLELDVNGNQEKLGSLTVAILPKDTEKDQMDKI
jgi:hypothetical protein